MSEVLTQREREVADLVAEGLSNKQIAERLIVSHSTVKVHVEHLIQKVGGKSRVHIARFVWANARGWDGS